jgi:hypothetical protein
VRVGQNLNITEKSVALTSDLLKIGKKARRNPKKNYSAFKNNINNVLDLYFKLEI